MLVTRRECFSLVNNLERTLICKCERQERKMLAMFSIEYNLSNIQIEFSG